tara:strand:- start:3830 stop:3979 length:150 start_codon:yes stop_codon:yes gene_type:complete
MYSVGLVRKGIPLPCTCADHRYCGELNKHLVIARYPGTWEIKEGEFVRV